jgi:hypothetical protein
MAEKTFPGTLREHLAAAQHEIWINWMIYLFTTGTMNEDGSYTIPAEKVKHWKRQIKTSYQDLTEKEKESDRYQADKILDVLKKA